MTKLLKILKNGLPVASESAHDTWQKIEKDKNARDNILKDKQKPISSLSVPLFSSRMPLLS